MRPRQPNKDADIRQERFKRHFPRLFAFVYGVTGNEEMAREATIAALASVLEARLLEEHDFTQSLYTAARKLVRADRVTSKDGLNAYEREVISLLFDAQLTREEVCELLGVSRDSLTSTLVSGLKKLQTKARSAPAAQRLEALSA